MPSRGSDRVLERLRTLHPKAIDLALDRTLRLLAAFDNPQDRLPPVVHVAGTNGKGSTVAYLRAMVEAAGGAAHAYTSPHLVRFAERIRVAGRIIDEESLLALLEECESVNGGQPITFFEVTTVAAFLAFTRRPADVCLLEVGLGGRVDATNVVTRPAVTVLTPISFDHTALLGKTLAAIAGEKAGIIKPGVPCVVARQEPEALAVIEARAAAVGAPTFVEGRDWRIAETGRGFTFTADGATLDLPTPALPGPHQFANAGLAVAAARKLDFAVSPKALAAGIAGAEWPARLQRLTNGPLVAALPAGWELWLDGGHNPAAGRVLADFIARTWRDRPLDLLIGMMATKDSQGFLDPLAPLVRQFRAVAIPGEASALPADRLAAIATAAGLAGGPVANVADGLAELAGGPGPARVLICGSLYLAGAVLADNGSILTA